MYLEILLRLVGAPPNTLTARNARAILKGSLDDAGVSLPRLFGHDENGNVQTLYKLPGDFTSYAAPPEVAVGGGENLLRLTAIGPTGCELLRSNLATIADAVGKRTGHLYSVNPYSGVVDIEASGPTLYRCNLMVVQKNTKHLLPILERARKQSSHERCDVPFDDLVPHIEKAITRGLIGQALHLDHAQPDMGSLLAKIPSDERLAVKVLEGETAYLKTTSEGKGLALGVRNLCFSIDAHLKGVWSAGQLRSRGYGVLRRPEATRRRAE